MEFDKPTVLPEDLPTLASLFSSGDVLEIEYLGGVPNVTYKVITNPKKMAIRVSNHGYTSIEHLKTEIEILKHLENSEFQKSPKLIRGLDGNCVQYWKGYPVCATEYIPGIPGDKTPITSELCHDVGFNLSLMQKSLSSFPRTPGSGMTLSERGEMMLMNFSRRAKRIGWSLDFEKIINQWQFADKVLLSRESEIPHQILHSDIWPPNIISDGDSVAGIIDFDDWCYGPAMIDLCAPLIEFPMFYSNEFNERFALELLKGYFKGGGTISPVEQELIIYGLEVGCAMWLACNALHEVSYEESEIYVYKLDLLSNSNTRNSLIEMINDLSATAISQMNS